MDLARLHHQTHRSKLQTLYIVRLLRELVNKLLVFFLPLYFFNLPFPFLQQFSLSAFQQGMLLVTAAYFINELLSLISAIPVAQLILKRGTRFGFIVGEILYVIFVLLLHASQQNPWLIILAMIIDGIQVSFFWNSYHYVLSRQTNVHKMGKNLGSMNFFLNLLGMVAPALGGIIIAALGYSSLFMLGIVLILLGLVFSLSFEETKIRDKISFQEFFSWLKEPGFRRLAMTFSGKYLNDGIITLWPLYIYLLWGTTEGVGLLYSFSLFFAMIISYLIGPKIDKRPNNRKPFYFSGTMLSFIWLMRIFVQNIWSIAVVDTFDRLTASYHWLFFDRSWLLRGKGSQALSYFVYRQMIRAVAGLFFWSLIFSLFFFFSQSWTVLFIIAGVGVLLTLLVQQEKEIIEI